MKGTARESSIFGGVAFVVLNKPFGPSEVLKILKTALLLMVNQLDRPVLRHKQIIFNHDVKTIYIHIRDWGLKFRFVCSSSEAQHK